MEKSNTPGPWEADGTSYDPRIVIYSESGRPVATIVKNCDRAEEEANGRLIAASPDLLKVAKMARDMASVMVGDMYEDEEARELLEAANAAIAKTEETAVDV